MRNYLAVFFMMISLSAMGMNTIDEENLYYSYRDSIEAGKSLKKIKDYKVYMDALWDVSIESDFQNFKTIKKLRKLSLKKLGSVQKLRAEVIELRAGSRQQLSGSLRIAITKSINERKLDRRILILLYTHFEWLKSGLDQAMVQKLKTIYSESLKYLSKVDSFREKTKEELQDLYFYTPDLASHRQGQYQNGTRLYMFCRKKREFPCLMLMRDRDGNPVYKEDGTLWSQPALADSKRDLRYNITNGYTPSGIHTMDGVMPYANRQISFGKFRRVILDWVPRTSQESLTKELLPSSSHDKIWWHQANVSRDLGRTVLRIHGTGKINDDPNSTHYPFKKTSGCIAQRENTYDGIEYRDQRLLLDTLMNSLGLDVVYQNETKIKGLLYLIEINDVDAPVKLEDLQKLFL